MAKPQLALALKDYLDEAERQVKLGNEVVYRINSTVMLLRSECYPNGQRELVVVGLTGNIQIGALAAINHARLTGFDSIRAHFFRKGALRYLQRHIDPRATMIERRGDERIIQIRF